VTDGELCDQLAARGLVVVGRHSSLSSTALNLGMGEEVPQLPTGLAVEMWFLVLWHSHMSPAFFGEATDKFKSAVDYALANPRSVVLMLGVAQLERPYMHASTVYNPSMSPEQFKTAMTATINRFTAMEKSCENS
jgi:hypothetical protein